MIERRRLKAGVEVEVTGSDRMNTHYVCRISGPGFWFWVADDELDLITEPIPEEPAEPKVGDEVTAEWLASEYANGRYHVVRNPGGTAASWAAGVGGTRSVCVPEGRVARHDSTGTWPLLALHPVERWEEPQSDPDFIDRRIANLERIWMATMEDLAARIEALEETVYKKARQHDPNPKEVMPDDAVQDDPGADDPSVEEVLEWLEDIESAFAASVTDAKMPITAARIIRELGEEIEEWASLYRRTHGKMAELRAEVASLTERLTITDEKVEAAYKAWIRGPSSIEAFRAALRAAGMIDPEVEG